MPTWPAPPQPQPTKYSAGLGSSLSLSASSSYPSWSTESLGPAWSSKSCRSPLTSLVCIFKICLSISPRQSWRNSWGHTDRIIWTWKSPSPRRRSTLSRLTGLPLSIWKTNYLMISKLKKLMTNMKNSNNKLSTSLKRGLKTKANNSRSQNKKEISCMKILIVRRNRELKFTKKYYFKKYYLTNKAKIK